MKNERIKRQILLDSLQTEVIGDPVTFNEEKFNVNIAIITEKCWHKVLGSKSSRNDQKYLVFKRKPKSFENLLLFAESENEIFYLRYTLDEILPYLSEEDCVVNIPLSEIFQRFGTTTVNQITKAEIDTLEKDLQFGLIFFE